MLLDGQNIQASNNSNYSPEQPQVQQADDDASKLSGAARYDAYGKLDVDMMRNAARGRRSRTATCASSSGRVTNYLFHPVYGGAIMNALALR